MMERVSPWWMVAAGMLGTGLGAGVFVVYAFAIFIGPMSVDLGWDRSTLSTAVAIFFFSTGIGTIWLGQLTSRLGIRRPAVLFMLVFVTSIACLAVLPAVRWFFFIDFFIMGVSGAAACAMPYAVAICGFFDERRGLALGTAVLGSGIGSALAPHLSTHLLATVGWRLGLVAIAGICAAPMIGIVLFLRTPPGAKATMLRSVAARSPKLLSDRNFYLIGLAVVGNSIAAVGLMMSIVPLAISQGLGPSRAAGLLSVAGAGSFAGRLIVGWLFDRFFAPLVGAALFIAAAAGAILIASAGPGAPAYLGAALVGTCLGAEADLVSFLVSRYFSQAAFSQVVGAMWVAWAWGGGIGTLAASRLFHGTVVSELPLAIFIALLPIAAICLLRLPPYIFASHLSPDREAPDEL